MLRWWLALVALIWCGPAWAGGKIALVVGNEAYLHATQLKQAPQDAKAVAAALKELGFSVTLVTNANNGALRRAVADFGIAAKGADVAFFYYAGHGVQVEGTNYLVPVDATLANPAYAEDEALNAQRVLNELSTARSALNVVVLDACRNNPFVRSWTGSGRSFGERGLDVFAPPPSETGFLLALATDPGEVAQDSGVYARSLVAHLKEPCVSLPVAFARVRDDVSGATNGAQRPWLNNGAGEAAYAYVPAGCAASAPADAERVAYEFAAQVNTAEVWRVFLKNHPAGPHAAAAKASLARLEAPPPPGPTGTTAPGGCVADAVLGCLRRIPGGTFTMGSATGEDDEKPPHSVTVAGFLLMESEVTQAMWERVMGKKPSAHKDCPECPVERVSWDDAVAFAKKLSTGGVTYRLPTEAEWEYAARGNEDFAYSGSSSIDAVAWYDGNSGGTTHTVCGKQRNAFGLCDMSGNVWEWTADWYKPYPGGTSKDYTGSSRVNRGGSWYNSAGLARVSFRSGGYPSGRYAYRGLRLARSL